MEDGHSIWQFQDDGKESCPKAVRVPPNPRGAIADRAFYAAPSLRHVEVATDSTCGVAAWQTKVQTLSSEIDVVLWNKVAGTNRPW